jgi:capsular exopolysaccharide synthesis family protein
MLAKHEAIWTRIAESDAAPDPAAPTGTPWCGARVHTVPWEVTDSSPLLALPGNEHAAEQYRAVRTRILLSPNAPTTLVVSSPSTGDGKTLTAINLAATFARKSDHDVLLVDADMRRPAVHSRLGMPQGPGLADILNGKSSFEEAMLRIQQLSNLFVLPSGGNQGNAGEQLDSPAWHTLVTRFRAQFRTVIYDSPPVDVFTDYDLIATDCDGVILVLTPDCTDRYLAFRALEKVREKLLGVLINRAEDWFLWKHHASNYYYYQQGTAQKKRSK